MPNGTPDRAGKQGRFLDVARPISRGVLTVIVIVAVLGAGIYAGIYYLIQRAKPFAQGEHCAISTPDGSRELDIEQAQTAATIAAP